MPTETLPIPRTTIVGMVAAYIEAEAKIRQAFNTLQEAETQLKQAFGTERYYFDLMHDIWNHHIGLDGVDKLMEHQKRHAWSILADRMELRRIMSTKRVQELDQQLQTGDGLLPVTEQNIMGVLDGAILQIPTFHEEAVKEVFEFLRPPGSHYKTNTEFEVGKRVIISWAVERKYGGGGFLINHQREQNLRGIDNVFHALDGKGLIKSYGGPLCDAIKVVDGTGVGETEYFKFRCYTNGNLHLEFKRLDLVEKLNTIASGNRLKPKTETKTQPNPQTSQELALSLT